MKTDRARRLDLYLSKKLGWNTSTGEWQCKCGFVTFSPQNFCSDCGKKMPKNPLQDQDGFDQLERAIAYALRERQPKELK